MTDTQAGLLPCPFCGGDVMGGRDKFSTPIHRYNGCILSGRPIPDADGWNRRPSPPASAEVVAGLVVDAIKDDLPGHIVKRIRRVVASAIQAGAAVQVPTPEMVQAAKSFLKACRNSDGSMGEIDCYHLCAAVLATATQKQGA